MTEELKEKLIESIDIIASKNYIRFNKNVYKKLITDAINNDDINLKYKVTLTNYSLYGWTLLMFNIVFGEIETCKLLLECGADPNIQDEFLNQTALHKVCSPGVEDAVEKAKLLLEYGANINIIDKLNRTAEEKAKFHGNLQLAAIILGKRITDGLNTLSDLEVNHEATLESINEIEETKLKLQKLLK